MVKKALPAALGSAESTTGRGCLTGVKGWKMVSGQWGSLVSVGRVRVQVYNLLRVVGGGRGVRVNLDLQVTMHVCLRG